MAWNDNKYIRDLLDKRERWGAILSLTAVAGLLFFLWDHPHRSLVKLGPFAIGAFGSLFILVVDCYYKQAEAIADAKTKEDKDKIKKLKWYKYVLSIKILGWLHILAPIVIGVLATLVLYCGIPSAPAANGAVPIQTMLNSGKNMTDDVVKIWTLVFTALSAVAAAVGAFGILYALKTFRFNTWLKAQAIYMDKEFYEARKTVLERFEGCNKNNPPTFTPKDKDDALIVCRKMDELARLTPYIKKEKIIETWGNPMGKSWIILEKLVDDVRTQDKNLKKWKAFQRLAEKANEKYNLE